MKIKLSRHARRQMKWRKIVEREIRTVIEQPDKLEDSVKGRKNAFGTVGGRVLKVTYKQEDGYAVIVTAIVK